MRNSGIIVLFALAIYGTTSISGTVITSPQITNWGDWGPWQYCPPGRYVEAFQLNTEPKLTIGDDTALNGIRLFCGDAKNPDTAVITSSMGPFGEWGKVFSCSQGTLYGFQMRVEPFQGSGDDTASNNIRFFCSASQNDFIEGDGLNWGDWTEPQFCLEKQAICGIRTQVEWTPEGETDCKRVILFECFFI